jgi:hypothetical protein
MGRRVQSMRRLRRTRFIADTGFVTRLRLKVVVVASLLAVAVSVCVAPAWGDVTLRPSAYRHGAFTFDLTALGSSALKRGVLLPGRRHLRARRLAAARSRGRLVVGRHLFDPAPPRHLGHRKLRRYRLRLKVSPASRLRFPPPALNDPVTVSAASASPSGGNVHQLNLSPARDYLVRMPPGSLEGGLTIKGGHNVVLIGGEIDVPMQPGNPPSIDSRRGLYLTNQTGTVHVEGLLIGGPDLSEGIDLSEPLGAVVQIENVRVDGVHARDESGFSDNHPDVLQTWAGPAELRVDRLSGSTDYQGIFLAPNEFGSQAPPRQVLLSHVDLRPTTTANCSCLLLWKGGSFPMQLDDVWVIPHPSTNLAHTLWPSPAPWGGVRDGQPPGGEFVPPGVAGVSYISPGYL